MLAILLKITADMNLGSGLIVFMVLVISMGDREQSRDEAVTYKGQKNYSN